MKRFLLLLFVLFATVFSYAQTEWIKFTAPDKAISISYPGTPQEQVSNDTASGITSVTKLYMYVNDKHTMAYMSSTTEYQNYDMNEDAELKANVTNFCKSAKVELVSSTNIKLLGKYNGIEFTAKDADRFYKSRVYIVNKKVYMNLAGGKPTETDASSNIDKFLNSFKLLNNKL